MLTPQQLADMDKITSGTTKPVLTQQQIAHMDSIVGQQPSPKSPVFSATQPFSNQDVITPTDIIGGTVPWKALGVMKERILKPAVRSLGDLPPSYDKPIAKPGILPQPTNLVNIGARVGASVTPRQIVETAEETALDPRTYMGLLTGAKDLEQPLENVAGKLRPIEEKIGGILGPQTKPGMVARAGAFTAGVEKNVLEDVAKIGYRNVLQKKYYSKEVPEALTQRIDQNIDNLRDAARREFDILSDPLSDVPFTKEYKEILRRVNAMSKNVEKNPFKGPAKDVNQSIVDGLKTYKVKSVKDLLDLRRFLDDVLYPAKRQGVKSSFGKAVRDTINEYLHKNNMLKDADEMWTNLERALEDGRKIVGETGETFLKRWAGLPAKTKESLSVLESRIGGEPFVQDLTNWSLAQKFLAKPGISGPFQALSKLTRPVLRGALRTGGAVNAARGILK